MRRFFETIAQYPHLFNPLATLTSDGSDITDAPTGSMRLSDDNKLNLALWNALFVGGAAAPLAFLANTLVNRKAENEVLDSSDKAAIEKLEFLRPRLVADGNLSDTSAHTEIPRRELDQLRVLKDSIDKRADGDGEGETSWFGGLDEWITESLGGVISDAAKNTIPVAALPISVLGAVGLSNYLNKKRIKRELEDRRLQNKNIQAAIDRKRLQLAGLIKSDATMPKKASADGLVKEAKQNSAIKNYLIDVPLLGAAIVSGALGIGIYNVLKNNDKNQAIVKYLKKKQLGSNQLQTTPEISVLDLPANPDEILAVPGDSKQIGLLDNNKPVALLENKELFTEVVPSKQKKKEKDAIF